MKKHKFRTLPLLLISLLLFSCQKEWKDPAFEIPVYTGKKANKTIADLKAMHVINSNQLDSIMPRGDFIVEAWVVSSDEGGNIYKSLYVQDATGGLEIPINKTGIHTQFPVGQKVFINCKGLVVGDYHSQYRMGWIYQGSVGQIHSAFVDRYFSKDGLPELEKAPFEITEIQSVADLTPENQSKWVVIRDCEFDASSVGQPLSGNDATTEHTVNFNGASVVVRTSNYAKFRSLACPAGKVDLQGILTIYNSTYQLLLRSKEDIQPGGNTPEEEVMETLSFDANSLSSGDWTVNDPGSSTQWNFQSAENAMFHQPGASVCDDWLISPEISLASVEGVVLYLEHRMTIQNLPEFFQVYYSTTHTDGTFNENDWIPFNPNLTKFPVAYGLSNALDVSVIPENDFRIAIRYHNATGENAARWYVKSLQFKK